MGTMMEIFHDPMNTHGCHELEKHTSTSKKSDVEGSAERLEKLDEGCLQYGCSHYRRRCHIKTPCCSEVFDCRHCHNEAKNSVNVDPQQRHDVPRHKIERVICSLCGTEQDISKQQYHCDGCGICRIGGRDNFFHCFKCGCCYSILLKDCHPCVERAMHHNCPVCFEFLFESTRDINVLPCGHTIHMDCLKEMQQHLQFFCPVCSKSVCDMSKVWEKLDEEVAATPMPESYQNKKIWILCNDCNATSEVPFHIVAQKCLNCNSYNTRQTRGCPTTNTCRQ